MGAKIPDGFQVVPIFETDVSAALRVGVLVSRSMDAKSGGPVLLRGSFDARVYLGCVTDSGANVQGWVEIWVQTVTGLKDSPAAANGALSNTVLDERWKRDARVRQAGGEPGICTEWETVHPVPTFIDPQSYTLVVPKNADGTPWRLCEDDALLERNGLPAFRSGLDRYWAVASADGAARFVPVTEGAPTAAATLPPEAALPVADAWPLNPEGGLMAVRPFSALGLDEYLGVLAGQGWEGLCCGGKPFDPEGTAAAIGKPDEPGRLFFEASEAGGRCAEIFLLKLGLLADAVEAVDAFVRGAQRPLLNLDESSFRVHLCRQGSAVPSLWTAKAALADCGDAVELPLENTEYRYFMRGRAQDLSVYRPQVSGGGGSGRCGIRVRQVLPETRKGVVVEGTLQTRENLSVETGDLVWLRLALPAGTLDLYATLEGGGAALRREWSFRTIEQKLETVKVGALKALAGVPLQNVTYEILPQQSTPCDLYALAVLAARLLFVGGKNTLPLAVDRMLSLAQEAECAGATDGTLAKVIESIFARDAEWWEALGPQYLVGGELERESAFQGLPCSLWWAALAMIVRMLPGPASFQTCHHLGDAAGGNLHGVLARVRADLADLLARTRVHLVGDVARNLEMRAVVQTCRQRFFEKGGGRHEG